MSEEHTSKHQCICCGAVTSEAKSMCVACFEDYIAGATSRPAPAPVAVPAGWDIKAGRNSSEIVIIAPDGSGCVVFDGDESDRVIPSQILYMLARTLLAAAPSAPSAPATVASEAQSGDEFKPDWAEYQQGRADERTEARAMVVVLERERATLRAQLAERDERLKKWQPLYETEKALRKELTEKLAASEARVVYARDLLIGAVNDIENWAGYASEYFQRKHKLHDSLAEYRGAIAGLAALPSPPAIASQEVGHE